MRAVVPVQRHRGALCANQDDAFHERARGLCVTDECGKERAEEKLLAFITVEQAGLPPAGKNVPEYPRLSTDGLDCVPVEPTWRRNRDHKFPPEL